jgi:hypothetical protein
MMVSNPGFRKSLHRINSGFNNDPNTILKDRCTNFNRLAYIEHKNGKFKNKRTE